MSGLGTRPSRRPVGSMQIGERRMTLVYDGNTQTLSEGTRLATIVYNAAGDYSITLADPAQRAIACMMTMRESDRTAYSENHTLSGCDIKVTDLAAAGAVDADMTIELICFDSADQV